MTELWSRYERLLFWSCCFSSSLICYYNNASGPCACDPVGQLGLYAVCGLGSYSSKQNFAYADINWKLVWRLTLGLG
jgi:hypothetical protein